MKLKLEKNLVNGTITFKRVTETFENILKTKRLRVGVSF